jgi:hypothetical protein
MNWDTRLINWEKKEAKETKNYTLRIEGKWILDTKF